MPTVNAMVAPPIPKLIFAFLIIKKIIPESSKQVDKQDYWLVLTVNKKTTLTGGILVTFQVINETYNIFITNNETKSRVLQLRVEK